MGEYRANTQTDTADGSLTPLVQIQAKRECVSAHGFTIDVLLCHRECELVSIKAGPCCLFMRCGEIRLLSAEEYLNPFISVYSVKPMYVT